MSRQDQHSSDGAFLNRVRRQLVGLEPAEQREILEELRGHLEDTASRLVESGASRETALEKAAAAMGDPTQVGRRLRREHMAKPLPLKYGLLAAVPLLAFALYFELFPIIVYFVVPRGENPGSVITAVLVLVLVFVIGVGLWGWWKGWRFLVAPLAGIVIAGALSTSWTYLAEPWKHSGLHSLVAPWIPTVATLGPDNPINSWLVVGPWIVVALAFLPVLVLLTWWGRIFGSLSLLGAIGMLALFVWTESPMSWLKLAACLAVCFGLAAFASVPRRHHLLAAWAVLLTDWALIALVLHRLRGSPCHEPPVASYPSADDGRGVGRDASRRAGVQRRPAPLHAAAFLPAQPWRRIFIG